MRRLGTLGYVLASLWLAASGYGQVVFNPVQRLQQTPYNGPRYAISGTIVDALTGAPVPRAMIYANTAGGQLHAFSGPDGHYEIDNAPAGDVFLTANKPGFSQNLGWNAELQTHLKLSADASDVTVKLLPNSEIKGKVIDQDGDPVENVHVEALTEQIVNGHKDWQVRGGASTSDDGMYRISNLTAGSYLLRTSTTLVPRSMALLFAQDSHPVVVTTKSQPQQWEVFKGMYFPNAVDKTQAAPIDLRPGDEAEADFRLSPVRAYAIRGAISGARNVSGSCDNEDGEPSSAGIRYNTRTGEFVLAPIAPGACTLRVRAYTDGQHTMYAEVPINVVASDVNNVRLELQPSASMPLQVQTTLPNIGVNATLTKRGHNVAPNNRVRGPGQNVITAFKGSQMPEENSVFREVAPGIYHVTAQVFPTGCAETITAGGTDLRREDLVVSPGAQPPPILVTVSDECGDLSGSVRDMGSLSNGVALLLRDGDDTDPQLAGFGPNGTFVFNRLPPGDYHVYAFADVNSVEYSDPEVRSKLPGQAVHIEAKQKAQVQVDLAQRPE